MQLNFRIAHIKERISNFCIFTNCFKMMAVFCFMGPINIFLFQQILETHTCIFCFKLPLDNFETKFNVSELILLCYNTYFVLISFTIFVRVLIVQHSPDWLKYWYLYQWELPKSHHNQYIDKSPLPHPEVHQRIKSIWLNKTILCDILFFINFIYSNTNQCLRPIRLCITLTNTFE